MDARSYFLKVCHTSSISKASKAFARLALRPERSRIHGGQSLHGRLSTMGQSVPVFLYLWDMDMKTDSAIVKLAEGEISRNTSADSAGLGNLLSLGKQVGDGHCLLRAFSITNLRWIPLYGRSRHLTSYTGGRRAKHRTKGI